MDHFRQHTVSGIVLSSYLFDFFFLLLRWPSSESLSLLPIFQLFCKNDGWKKYIRSQPWDVRNSALSQSGPSSPPSSPSSAPSSPSSSPFTSSSSSSLPGRVSCKKINSNKKIRFSVLDLVLCDTPNIVLLLNRIPVKENFLQEWGSGSQRTRS